MKKSLLLLTVTLILASSFKSLSQDSWSNVLKKGEGTLGIIYYQQPGIIQKDQSGKLNGLCVDILEDFVNFVNLRYGKKISIKYISEETVFSVFIERVKSTPDIIGVGNITITPERKKFLTFTESFLTNPVILLSHKTSPDISSQTQIATKFNGYTALVVDKSTHETYIKKIKSENYPTLAIRKTTSGLALMDEMAKDNKTFGVIDLTEYIYAIRNKLPLKRHDVKLNEKNEELGFATSLNNDWHQPWKEFLTTEYKQSVSYRKHIVDNLGASFLSLVEM